MAHQAAGGQCRKNALIAGSARYIVPRNVWKIMPDHFEPDLNFCKGAASARRNACAVAITMMPEGDFDNEGKKGELKVITR